MFVPVRVWPTATARRWAIALSACGLLYLPCAQAQGHGGGLGHSSGFGGGLEFRDRSAASAASPANAGRAGARATGLHLVPAGRWWDEDGLAHTLGLNASQQKRMDEIFSSHRANLLTLYKSLDHELGQLDKLGRARTPDEAQIFTQIDRVNQARSDLEKGLAHVQLEMRKELTTEQSAKMDDLRTVDSAPPPTEPSSQSGSTPPPE